MVRRGLVHVVEERGDDNVLQPFHHTGQHDSVLGAWFCGPRDSWLVLYLMVEGGILRMLPPASWLNQATSVGVSTLPRSHFTPESYDTCGVLQKKNHVCSWAVWLASKCGTSASSVGAKSTTSGTQPCSLYAFSTAMLMRVRFFY